MLRAFGTGLIACEKRIVHRVIHRKCESIGSPLVRARMKTGCARRWDRQEDVPEDGGPSMLIVGIFAQGAVDETGFTETLSGTAIRYLGDTQ